MQEFGSDDSLRAAEVLGRRLAPADIRKVLREIDSVGHGTKGIERIVSETEDRGHLLQSRVRDEDLARFLVDVAGQDVLSNRSLRKVLAFRSSEAELDELHQFPLAQTRAISQEAIARCVAERSWHPGKRWPRYFASVLGFPPAFAGFSGIPGGPNHEDVEPHIPLKPLTDFQEDLRLQVLDVMGAKQGENRAILTLPTGAGKTRTTVEALVDWWLNRLAGDFIVWIAQSEELCDQAVQAFREVWIDRGDKGVRDSIRLYRFWGARTTVPDDDGIIVTTIDKLRHALFDNENTSMHDALTREGGLGIVVIDEAHRAEATSYRRVLEALGIDFSMSARSQVPVLGLTATPLRSQHDETVRLARRFYRRLLQPRNLSAEPVDIVTKLRERGVLSRPVHQFLPHVGRAIKLTADQERYMSEWKDMPPELLVQLSEEKDRNRQLLQAMLSLESNWPVLFFGCSVQHAQALAVLLRRNGRKAACITADTRDATRRHLIDSFRHGEVQILCNYGVLTTGFDAPQVRAVVIGRPTASRVLYDQMIGRGMRGPEFGGTEECLVIDVDDNLIHLDGSRITTAAREYDSYWAE